MNFISHKNCIPINLDLIISFRKVEGRVNEIHFSSVSNILITWTFSTLEELNKAYKQLISYYTVSLIEGVK